MLARPLHSGAMMPFIVVVVLVAAVLYAVWMAGELGLGPGFRRPRKKPLEVVEAKERKRA